MTSLDAFPPRCAALCELLGIALPVIGAPMGGVSGPELAAAVSAAGGLGLLGVSVVDLAGTREQIRAAKALTDQPIGVGLLFPTNPEAAGTAPPAPTPIW